MNKQVCVMQNLTTTQKNGLTGEYVLFVMSALISMIAGSIGATVIAAIASGHRLGTHSSFEGAVGALMFYLSISIFFGIAAHRKCIQIAAFKEPERERVILAFAKQENRAVTVPDVALNCGMRIVDSALVLNRLTARGVCQMDITEDGQIIYSFQNCYRQIR